MVFDPARLSRSRLDRALPDFSGHETRGFLARLAEHRTYASFLQRTVATNRRPQLLLADVDEEGRLREGAALGLQLLGANEGLQPHPGLGWVSGHASHLPVAGLSPSSRIGSEHPYESGARC